MLAEQAEPELTGPQQITWLDRLEREHGNIRAALEWFLASSETELAAQLGGAIWRFWSTRGYLSEGRRWLNLILSSNSPISPSSHAKILHAAGALAAWQSDYTDARHYFEQSLALRRDTDDRPGIATTLIGLGVVAKEQGDYAHAQSLLAEALPLLRALGDTWGIAMALNNLGALAGAQNKHDQAQAFHEESLALRRILGNTQGVATSLCNLGMVAYSQGDYARARDFLEQSEILFRRLNDQRALANILSNLGSVEHWQGNYRLAINYFLESIALFQAIGEARGIAECLVDLAGTKLMQHLPLDAARLYGAAEALRDSISVPLEPAQVADHERGVAEARAHLGEPAFGAAWAAGRAMRLDEAIDLAMQQRLDKDDRVNE